MLTMKALLAGFVETECDVTVKGLCLHSKYVEQGDVFCALSLEPFQHSDYIDEAIAKGAKAILIAEPKTLNLAVPNFYIKQLKTNLPILAKRCYPQAPLARIIAITGTNGKTSVACFLIQALRELGKKCAYIGTLGVDESDREITKLANTTPDICSLYKILNRLVVNNHQYVVIETSSHALVQQRLAGLSIDYALFTNLSQDHLDYHQTMVDYGEAKALLFNWPKLKYAIINRDDAFGRTLFAHSSAGYKIAYGLALKEPTLVNCDELVTLAIVKNTASGFLCRLNNHLFEVPFLGVFNVYNVLAVITLLKQLKVAINDIIITVTKLTAVKGRMQQMGNRLIWVDFAHTPQALELSIKALRDHFPDKVVRVVFGCGGNRDVTKRPLMGKVAYQLADSIVLTNDNCRAEKPADIINDITAGMPDLSKVHIIPSRKKALKTAVKTLRDDECLLIAGRGHETTQIMGDKVVNFSDIDYVKTLL